MQLQRCDEQGLRVHSSVCITDAVRSVLPLDAVHQDLSPVAQGEVARAMNALPRPWLGWPLLPLPDEAGALSWPLLEDSLRQLIRVLLSTRPGEQLMRPDFGAGLELLLHEPNNLATRRRIRDAVQESLSRW